MQFRLDLCHELAINSFYRIIHWHYLACLVLCLVLELCNESHILKKKIERKSALGLHHLTQSPLFIFWTWYLYFGMCLAHPHLGCCLSESKSSLHLFWWPGVAFSCSLSLSRTSRILQLLQTLQFHFQPTYIASALRGRRIWNLPHQWGSKDDLMDTERCCCQQGN